MSDFIAHPATPERWPDLVEVFGPSGVGGGCWCMFWRRRTRSEYVAAKGEANRCALRDLVLDGHEPGLIGYQDGLPVGWCAVAPRAQFPGLERSPSRRPVDDDDDVWAITCVYVASSHRRQGNSRRLVEAAVAYVERHGGRVVEAYPVPAKRGVSSTNYAFTGFEAMFRDAGFRVYVRRRPTRPIMRYDLAKGAH